MKIIEYMFGPAFKHFFAILVMLFSFIMLAWGGLSETGQTRMEDLAAMVVGYYFLASMSGTKKDETLDKMVDNQKQLVETTVPVVEGSIADSDLIKSGDPITVIKE